MAYTNEIDPTVPLGSSSIAQGDDAIRMLAGAVKERLETLVDDLDADPLVLKQEQVTPYLTDRRPLAGRRIAIPALGASFPRHTTTGSPLQGVDLMVIGANWELYHSFDAAANDLAVHYPVLLPHMAGDLPPSGSTTVDKHIAVIRRYRLRCQRLDDPDRLDMRLILLRTSGPAPQPLVSASSSLGVQFLDSGLVNIPVSYDSAVVVEVTVGFPTHAMGTWIGTLYVDYDLVEPTDE